MLKQISDVVLKAGSIVSSGFHSAKTIKHKGEVDLVTEYDIRTENFLKEKLQKIFPSFTTAAGLKVSANSHFTSSPFIGQANTLS